MKKIGTWIARFLTRHRQMMLARLAYELRGPQSSAKTFSQFCRSNSLDVGPTTTNEGHSLAWARDATFVIRRHHGVGTDGSLDIILLAASRGWWKSHPELRSHYERIAARSVTYVGIASNCPAATRKTMARLWVGSAPVDLRASSCRHVPTSFHC